MATDEARARIDRLEEELLFTQRQNEQMHELLLQLNGRFDGLSRRLADLEDQYARLMRRTGPSTPGEPESAAPDDALPGDPAGF